MGRDNSDYKKVYLDRHGYSKDEFIPCLVCSASAVDIHHIVFRSQGGRSTPDNLIALCRTCHDRAHGKTMPKLHPEYLKERLADLDGQPDWY